MNNVVRVGIGVMIIDNDKILLGHRLAKRSDTGGLQEPDCWSLPGGKQEMFETMFEGAKREIKEETNLDIDELELFGAADDIAKDRHFVTLHIIAKSFNGKLIAMEPEKEDKWEWFSLNELPENIYSPSKKFIDNYLKKRKCNEKSKTKLTPIFQTKEQEELFARCSKELMHKTMTGEISYLSIDESMNNVKSIVSSVFQTKEQEELFARIAQETMFRYTNEENAKKKILK